MSAHDGDVRVDQKAVLGCDYPEVKFRILASGAYSRGLLTLGLLNPDFSTALAG